MLGASTLFSCSESGPCQYKHSEFVKAEVVDIQPVKGKDDAYHVYLEFDQSILGREQQELGALRNTTISGAFLDVNQIEVGNIYTATVSELQSGNCEPYYIGWDAGFKQP